MLVNRGSVSMKILLLEDDPPTSERLAATLSSHHHAVDVAEDGAEGLEMAMQWPYDLLIVDWLLPSMNGLEVCRQLRQRGNRTPILMLTVRDANADIVAGLDAGADDYLAKSSDPSQLLARVRALLRRSQVATDPVLRWGDLTLDPAHAQVSYQGQPIPCRPKEYELLELFLRNPHRLLTRSAIIDHLWPMADTPVEGSVTNLIKDLRQRLKQAGITESPIETVYGLGYRLRTPATTIPEASDFPAPLEADLPEPEPLIADDTLPPRLAHALAGATQRFQTALAQRLALLDQVATEAARGTLTPADRQRAFTEAHRLAGGLGLFGYGQAAEAAEEIEALLQATAAADLPHLASQMQQHLATLKQALASDLP
jgi:DNA-binding response OmpR family regulator/HPt (histidine-containing phosphotransfer) domain-containing protein